MAERVNDRWLVIPGNDNTRTLVASEIMQDRRQKTHSVCTVNANLIYRIYIRSKQYLSHPFHSRGKRRRPMVRLGSRRGRRALDRVEPAHIPGVGIAALCEIACVARHPRESGIQKICIERNDYICGIELISGLNRLAKRHLRARVNIIAIDWLVEMPLGFRKLLEQLLLLVGQR